MLKQIHHAAIICSNYEKSKSFYVDLLGLKVIRETFRSDRQSYKLDLQIGTSQIELFSFSESPSRLSYPEARGLRHLAFEVENVDLSKEWLENKGIEVEAIRIDELTGKKFTFFCDPDGLPLELYEADYR